MDKPTSLMSHGHDVAGFQLVTLPTEERYLVTLADNVKVTQILPNGAFGGVYTLKVDNVILHHDYRLFGTPFDLVLASKNEQLAMDFTRNHDSAVVSPLYFSTGAKLVDGLGEAMGYLNPWEPSTSTVTDTATT